MSKKSEEAITKYNNFAPQLKKDLTALLKKYHVKMNYYWIEGEHKLFFHGTEVDSFVDIDDFLS